MITRALALTIGLSACGGGALKAAGEPCTASSECAPKLLCDFGQTPAVCASDGTSVAADAARGPDADPAVPDAAAGAPDASPPDAPLPDAAPPDAAPP